MQLDWNPEAGDEGAALVDVASRNLIDAAAGNAAAAAVAAAEDNHLVDIGWGSDYSPCIEEEECVGGGGAGGLEDEKDDAAQAGEDATKGSAAPKVEEPEGSDTAGEGGEGASGTCSAGTEMVPGAAAGAAAPGGASGLEAAAAREVDASQKLQDSASSLVGESRGSGGAAAEAGAGADGGGAHSAGLLPVTTASKLGGLWDDAGLGGQGAARLMWAAVQIAKRQRGDELDKAKIQIEDMLRNIEDILAHGMLDLQPKELVDLVFAVTETMRLSFKRSLQQQLCLASILCVKGLEDGEVTFLLMGLMQGGRPLPSTLLEGALDRIRATRRGLSVNNCKLLLEKFVENYGTAEQGDEDRQVMDWDAAQKDAGRVEAEKARQWQLQRKIAHELCVELSLSMADAREREKLDAKGLAAVMRAVSVLGVRLSLEDGRNLSRRALEIHGGDRRRARAAERAAGLDTSQLIQVLGGFVASGLFSEDSPGGRDDAGEQRGDRERGERWVAANFVTILCEELRGKVKELEGVEVVQAIVAAAVGGAAPKWNAMDVVDGEAATLELPEASATSKSAMCRKDLVYALLEPLCAKLEEIAAARLMDVVCACALAEMSCGAGELLQVLLATYGV